jgi:hypothetical protein
VVRRGGREVVFSRGRVEVIWIAGGDVTYPIKTLGTFLTPCLFETI